MSGERTSHRGPTLRGIGDRQRERGGGEHEGGHCPPLVMDARTDRAPFMGERERAMSTITVSLGRNVGDEPMHPTVWQAFRAEAWDSVDFQVWAYGGQIVFTGQGEGKWKGEDGTTTYEDAYTIIALVPDEDADIVGGTLVHAMGRLAAKYGQEAIAVTLGTTTLAGLQQATSN